MSSTQKRLMLQMIATSPTAKDRDEAMERTAQRMVQADLALRNDLAHLEEIRARAFRQANSEIFA